MSCGHDSFMADADRLTGKNPRADDTWGPPFQLQSLRCYDMFPFTPHIETLGVFVRERVGDGRRPESIEPDRLQVSPEEKLQCQFFIGIEQDAEFNVRQRIFGERGHHMKVIAKQTGAKLRLRGRGSGFKEGPERRVSSDPLMLCVSSTEDAGHQEAVRLVEELLTDVHNQYREFCHSTGRRAPNLEVVVNHGPRPGSR
ncbi:khdc4 [Symbiodinium natans]|uniref:Khdc4 protein n=1 Tax=Symbiodinium natans TaxID=878477 RepID=A0A812MH13_9DINO|nr:khdc4 [Symbiodinium natans]